MIKASFFIKGDYLSGFEISGHSGFAESGSDIVCAAVSSAAYLTANTVTEVIGALAEADESDGRLRLTLASPDEKTEIALRGLELHLKELSALYPKNITLKYGGVKNA